MQDPFHEYINVYKYMSPSASPGTRKWCGIHPASVVVDELDQRLEANIDPTGKTPVEMKAPFMCAGGIPVPYYSAVPAFSDRDRVLEGFGVSNLFSTVIHLVILFVVVAVAYYIATGVNLFKKIAIKLNKLNKLNNLNKLNK